MAPRERMRSGRKAMFGRSLRLFALLYLVAVAGFGFGVLTMHFKTWPYSLMQEVKLFIAGDPFEKSSFLDKIAGELGSHIQRQSISWSAGVDRTLFRELDHPALREGFDAPLIYTTAKVSPYPKAIQTMFLFDDAPLSVILLDGQGEIRHRWNIGSDCFEMDEPGAGGFFSGDFVVLDDGSLISFVSNRNGLFRLSYAGELMWRTEGYFHHYMSLGDDGFVWVFGKPGRFADPALRRGWNHTELLHKVDVRDGRIVKTIRLVEIMERNLDRLDPFFAERSRAAALPSGLLTEDLWHPNDVEPLPASIADKFPDFAAGDLALSFRELNLILVMDPETLAIKWWSQGAAQLQHDPDWQPDGTMTFLNNRSEWNSAGNARHKFSAIQRFNFRSLVPETLIEGIDYNFATEWGGFHDIAPDGSMLISSTSQGRVFELTPSGEIAMEFIHRYHQDTGVYSGSVRYVDPALIESKREDE